MNTDLDVLVGPVCNLTGGKPIGSQVRGKKKNEYRVTLYKLLKKKKKKHPVIIHLNSFKMCSVFEAFRMHFRSPRGIIRCMSTRQLMCVSLYLKL